MRLALRKSLLFYPLLALVCQAQPVVQAVLNGSSFSGNLAPGMWAAVFGTQLATGTTSATAAPLSTTLGGVSVSVGGIPAPLFYVSPTQINMIVPFEAVPTSIASTTPVVVTTSAGPSANFNIMLSRNSPGVFSQNGGGTGPAIAFDATFKPVTTIGSTPIVLYAAGLGPTVPAASSSSGGAAAEPFNRIQDDLSVFIGDRKATVAFAGLAPGLPGIYQLNVIPNNPVSDRLYLQVNGWQSNVTTLPVPAGANVANVVGTIDGLYPPTGASIAMFGAPTTPPSFAFSAAFVAGGFKASFDVLPNAKPFSLVATSEGGAAIIAIDPAAKTWQAAVAAPAAAPLNGTFANTEFTPVLDFASCETNGACLPFPGNIIPQSRMDPIRIRVGQFLGLPTSVPQGSANGVRTSSGSLPASGHFDTDLLGSLIYFGGFVQIAHPGPTTRTTPFRLYIDNKLVASTDATYTVQ